MLNKKLVLGAALAAVFSSSAFAETQSAYVSGQLGMGWQHIKDFSQTTEVEGVAVKNTLTSKDTKGLAGRIAVGYNLNENLALELGGVMFSNAKWDRKVVFPDPAFSITGEQKFSTYAIDLLAKGSVPVNDEFSVYGKAGVAYVHHKWENTETLVTPNLTETSTKETTTHSYRPELAIGAAYKVDENLAVDLSFARIFGQGELGDEKYTPNLDLLAVGLTYSFS